MPAKHPTTPMQVTNSERELIALLRSGQVTEAEMVTVPTVYFNFLTVTVEAMKVAAAKATYAADLGEFLLAQTATPATE